MKHLLSIFLVLASCTAFAKKQEPNLVTIFPCRGWDLNVESYRYDPTLPSLNLWQKIDKILRKHKLQLTVSKDFDQATFDKSAKIICLNIPNWIPGASKMISLLPRKKSILITFEPPSVIRSNFSPTTFRAFHKILTWDDALIDNKKFFKFNYFVLQPMIKDIPPYSQKKFLTQISGHKHSSHPNELYSERRKVIDYFEKRPSIEFEFYGKKWDGKGYRNYKGAPPCKLAVLKNYKFSICYENMKDVKGYITEKIFDCFAAGCVPIYWGASNVRYFIPSNCFIAREDFSSFDALVDFLQKMDEQTYNQYLQNIRTYLNSQQAQEFSAQTFAKTLLEVLEIPNPPLE